MLDGAVVSRIRHRSEVFEQRVFGAAAFEQVREGTLPEAFPTAYVLAPTESASEVQGRTLIEPMQYLGGAQQQTDGDLYFYAYNFTAQEQICTVTTGISQEDQDAWDGTIAVKTDRISVTPTIICKNSNDNDGGT